jgi:hypothetical protein
MKLGSFNRTTNHYDCLRALTPEELEKHAQLLPVLTGRLDRSVLTFETGGIIGQSVNLGSLTRQKLLFV